MTRPYSAICPMCERRHKVRWHNWLIPDPREFMGYIVAFECDAFSQSGWVTKYYDESYRYICYLFTAWENDEIPF